MNIGASVRFSLLSVHFYLSLRFFLNWPRKGRGAPKAYLEGEEKERC